MNRPPHPGRPTLRRQLRAAAILIMVLAAIVGIAYGVYYFTVGRPLLAGGHHHAFGIVDLADKPVTLEHSFVLTNRTSRTIKIENIKTSCGCTVASHSADILEPGGSAQITAKLTLSTDGRKKARIYLDCGDRGVEVLRLEAVARRLQRLLALRETVILEPGRPVERTIIYLDYDSNDQPPPPRITAPPGLRAEFTQWTQVKRRQRTKALPARWRGTVQIEQLAPTLPDDTALIIRVGPDQELTIPVEPVSTSGAHPSGSGAAGSAARAAPRSTRAPADGSLILNCS
ncbi:MAG: DUF1573 domain-containing protein [Planctomycetes bacterium]|nr:DUF1573 domain-containing protein [Planctomycetota bacterium]